MADEAVGDQQSQDLARAQQGLVVADEEAARKLVDLDRMDAHEIIEEAAHRRRVPVAVLEHLTLDPESTRDMVNVVAHHAPPKLWTTPLEAILDARCGRLMTTIACLSRALATPVLSG